MRVGSIVDSDPDEPTDKFGSDAALVRVVDGVTLHRRCAHSGRVISWDPRDLYTEYLDGTTSLGSHIPVWVAGGVSKRIKTGLLVVAPIDDKVVTVPGRTGRYPLLFRVIPDEDFVNQGGDSGAAVCTVDTDQPVGMIVAKDTDTNDGYCVPVHAIIDAVGQPRLPLA